MNDTMRSRLLQLSTTNLSDALESLKLPGGVYGIHRTWEGCEKIVGEAVTVKLTAAGRTPSKTHLGVNAIEAASRGDIIVVDNGGRIDVSCWGGVLATGAKLKGISGIVIDGACRDIDDYVELGFSVYARGSVVATARGRIMEQCTNEPIQFAGVQVCPGDVVMADRSGVVFVPADALEAVLAKAEQLLAKEEAMYADLRSGMSSLEVDHKYNYEKMLK